MVFLFPPGEPVESPAALPAGCAEFGEPPEETAVREVREETGLEVIVVRELPGRSFNRDCPLGPMLTFFFEARAVGGALRDGAEGRVAVFPAGAFPAISPNREGSRRALAAYLAAQPRGHRRPQPRSIGVGEDAEVHGADTEERPGRIGDCDDCAEWQTARG